METEQKTGSVVIRVVGSNAWQAAEKRAQLVSAACYLLVFPRANWAATGFFINLLASPGLARCAVAQERLHSEAEGAL